MIYDGAVVVASCSKPPYPRTWSALAALIARWWPDRPWPLYLATDALPRDVKIPTAFGYDGVLVSGAPVDAWGRSLIASLRQIDARWVLLLMDDYFATGRWETETLERVLTAAALADAHYLRVCPVPGPDAPHARIPGVGICTPGAEYRCSLQAAFWQRDYLMRLARDIATPWRFELDQRGDPAALHLSVTRDLWPTPYSEALKRGVWLEAGAEACRKGGVAWPGATS